MFNEIHNICQIGTEINNKFIEKVEEPVLSEAFLCSIHGDFYPSHYSADGDKHGSFKEAIKYATTKHFNIWQQKHEHNDVLSHTTECIKYRLNEEEFYGPPLEIDTTQCGHHTTYNPTIITESNQKDIIQCLSNSANDLTWLQSESLQEYFQTLNPCCWDGKPPKKRYGNDWIEDTETRLICMIHDIPELARKRIKFRKHTLSGTQTQLSYQYWGYQQIIEYDRQGEEFEYH